MGTEPIWITLIAVVLYFVIFFLFLLPKEVARKREEDKAYAEKKGITLEKLYELRQKQRNRRIPKSTRDYIFQRDNYTCQHCGSIDNLEIDHIFPFSRGGGNEPENLQLLCKTCNLRKGDSIPLQFRSKV